MGCNSVYTKGFPNVFYDNEPGKVAEGRALCDNVLEPLLEYSRLSVSYGYISPELSRNIVKYQDPDKPSYHRWDAGAACDVILHDRVNVGAAPVLAAFWIDENLPVSRVITYSESPFICVASRKAEILSGDHRRALYENRYVGERKPKYISYSDSPNTRARQKREVDLSHDWRGAGYPTYHGGGTQQMHHQRASTYTMVSDFLYSTVSVQEGCVNVPTARRMARFREAGALYDSLVTALDVRRLSIVRGYESPSWIKSRHNWVDGICLVVIPPNGLSPDTVVDCALSLAGVWDARVLRGNRVGIQFGGNGG